MQSSRFAAASSAVSLRIGEEPDEHKSHISRTTCASGLNRWSRYAEKESHGVVAYDCGDKSWDREFFGRYVDLQSMFPHGR